MATIVFMKHVRTGHIRKGFTGFSWTVFLFGPLPMLWRRDWLPGMAYLLLYCLFQRYTPWLDKLPPVPFWLPFLTNLLLALTYNKAYSLSLLRRGYRFCEVEVKNMLAASAVGLPPEQCCLRPDGSAPLTGPLPQDRTVPAILILSAVTLAVFMLVEVLSTPKPLREPSRPLPPLQHQTPLPPARPIRLNLPPHHASAILPTPAPDRTVDSRHDC